MSSTESVPILSFAAFVSLLRSALRLDDSVCLDAETNLISDTGIDSIQVLELIISLDEQNLSFDENLLYEESFTLSKIYSSLIITAVDNGMNSNPHSV